MTADVPDPRHGRTAVPELHPSAPVGTRAGRVVIGVVGLLVIFGPLLVWLLGGRAEMIDNRPFAAAPTLSQGFEISDQTTAFFTDRLPIRGDAVDVRREVSERIFGEPPQERLIGKHQQHPRPGRLVADQAVDHHPRRRLDLGAAAGRAVAATTLPGAMRPRRPMPVVGAGPAHAAG